jgi:hypothetical protein
MVYRVRATQPPKPKNNYVVKLGIGLAGVLTFMAVSQLFQFDEFDTIISSNEPLAAIINSSIIVALVTSAEIFALPFLLRMRISPALRVFSMFLGWSVALFWLYRAVLLPVVTGDVIEVGLLGSILSDIPQLIYSIVATLIAIAVLIVTLGMWPIAKHRAR